MRGRRPTPLTIAAADLPILEAVARSRRQKFIEHVLASGPEYNRLYAHPFDWSWTNDRMRKWFAEHAR